MTDLIIDPEFRDLLPPLPDDKRKQLEEKILQNGIREPLVLWQGILIDGHNRYEIAKRHNLTFTTVDYQFDDRSDVRLWIANNQFGRRDLNTYERSLLALKIKPDIAKKAKENQGTRSDLNIPQTFGESKEETTDKEPQKNEHNNETDTQVAKLAGVSRETIRKVEKIEKHATPEVKAVAEMTIKELREGQEIGKLVLLAEARLGELFKQMPKATTNHKRQDLEIPPAGKFLNDESESEEEEPPPKPKLEVAAQMGFNKNQVAQFQTLADNPEIVNQTIAEAKENGTIPTRAAALKNIQQAKKIPIQQNTGNNERYTPKEYIDAARKVLGTIDIDYLCVDARKHFSYISSRKI